MTRIEKVLWELAQLYELQRYIEKCKPVPPPRENAQPVQLKNEN